MISQSRPVPAARVQRVALSGEIDIASRVSIVEAFDQISDCDLAIVDLRAVTYIDSTGLSTLIALKRRLRAIGGDVHLVLSDPRVIRLIQVCGFDKIFTVEIEGAAG